MKLLRCISKAALLFCLGATGGIAYADMSRRQELEHHLAQLASDKRSSVEARFRRLLNKAVTEKEKAWLTYRWVTTHFKHDSGAAVLIGNPARLSIDHLFKVGAGSCEVYAHVMHYLLTKAGLRVQTIYGYVKGGPALSMVNGKRVNHVWNAVEIEGVWYTIDATWGAGYVDRHGFHREQSDLFFLIPPDRAVLSHFDPEDRHGYQAGYGIDLTRFKLISDEALFVAAVGFNPSEILKYRGTFSQTGLVGVYNPMVPTFRVIDAPLKKRLEKRRQKFTIESTEYEQVMVVQGKSWVPLEKRGQIHSAELDPVKGELLVMARRPKQFEYEALLSYLVD